MHDASCALQQQFDIDTESMLASYVLLLESSMSVVTARHKLVCCPAQQGFWPTLS